MLRFSASQLREPADRLGCRQDDADPDRVARMKRGTTCAVLGGAMIAAALTFGSPERLALLLGWRAVDGALSRAGEAGDIVTVDEFGDFELTLEWSLPPNGNSGVLYRVTEDDDVMWHAAPEYQIIDNAYKEPLKPVQYAGANYDLHPPLRDATKPIGSWNQTRLLVRGPHVEHWLNGVKVVEYELWSPDWERRVRESKFKDYPNYGRARRGHIGLQDHGDRVAYRNIRIRDLRN